MLPLTLEVGEPMMISFFVGDSSSVVDAAADAMIVDVLPFLLVPARIGSEEFRYLLTYDPSA